ncbi:putative holin-like toxin [Brevibacillus laterosporus]|uniref:Holin-like toxin n=1 Tax=Brevibacillus halotolerans TaxID=1507437 RepID=A0ABT4I5K2_9BACL|nr:MULTISPECIES: putative holin-like toxin [Brevibacillus]MCR8987981.1 putative holin-like toxin [Brevibacillus laterosporus]MCZ0833720.1 putative holin-like toxin [Brevibacillus halotolerans]
MSVYESLMVMLTFGLLVIALIGLIKKMQSK